MREIRAPRRSRFDDFGYLDGLGRQHLVKGKIESGAGKYGGKTKPGDDSVGRESGPGKFHSIGLSLYCARLEVVTDKSGKVSSNSPVFRPAERIMQELVSSSGSASRNSIIFSDPAWMPCRFVTVFGLVDVVVKRQENVFDRDRNFDFLQEFVEQKERKDAGKWGDENLAVGDFRVSCVHGRRVLARTVAAREAAFLAEHFERRVQDERQGRSFYRVVYLLHVLQVGVIVDT